MVALFVAPATGRAPARGLVEPLTVGAIAQFVREEGIRSIDELIPALPETMRARYTLMYASQSLQEASPVAPRAILYSADAGLVVSFNGSPAQKGYDRLELMQVDPETRALELYEMTFGPAAVTVSPKNPAQCLLCHGERPAPIWDSYFLWVGAYGGMDKVLRPGGSAETTYYDRFVAEAQRTGRYQSLGPYPAGTNRDLGQLLGRVQHRGLTRAIRDRPELFAYRYAILASLGCDDRARDLATNPISGQLTRQLPMPAELSTVEAFLPAGWTDGWRTDADVLAQTVDLTWASFESRVARHRRLTGDRLDQMIERVQDDVASGKARLLRNRIHELGRAARFRRLLDEIGGGDLRLTLEFGETASVFIDGDDNFDTLNQLLWMELLSPETDAELREAYATARERSGLFAYDARFGGREGVCRALRQKSLAALAGRRPPGPRATTAKPVIPAALSSCIACHSGAAPIGPAIPFDEPAAMTARLSRTGEAGDSFISRIEYRLSDQARAAGKGMPPVRELGAEAREDVFRYFGRLMAP